jgi:hypothetical protein
VKLDAGRAIVLQSIEQFNSNGKYASGPNIEPYQMVVDSWGNVFRIRNRKQLIQEEIVYEYP